MGCESAARAAKRTMYLARKSVRLRQDVAINKHWAHRALAVAMKLHWSGALRSHALTTMRWLGVLRIHLALKAKPRAQNIGYACIWRAHACRECCKINLQIDDMAKSCGYARLLCRGTIFAVAFDVGTHGNPANSRKRNDFSTWV